MTSCLLLHTVRQDKILGVDSSNLTVRVEAGMIGQDMEQQVCERVLECEVMLGVESLSKREEMESD